MSKLDKIEELLNDHIALLASGKQRFDHTTLELTADASITYLLRIARAAQILRDECSDVVDLARPRTIIVPASAWSEIGLEVEKACDAFDVALKGSADEKAKEE